MLVIFDCDGVLIDSEIIACRTSAEFANKYGNPITTEEVIRRFTGKPTRLLWETICKETGIAFDEDVFRELIDYTHSVFKSELQTTNGIAQVLEKMPVEFGVASTTRLDNLKRNLAQVGLIDYFGENIFSASQVAHPKPAPDVYLFAAKNMGYAPKDCIVIEDSIPGVQAAKAAGMNVFGYCGASHIAAGHDEILIQNGATACFYEMNHFYDFLNQQGIKIMARKDGVI